LRARHRPALAERPGRTALHSLIGRLRPVLEGSETPWPATRSRLATDISRDLAKAVAALDVAVEELYFQAESLESAHLALEIERKSYQELFDGGPDGYLVTDPRGVILRANRPVGVLFASRAENLVGEMLPNLMRPEDRTSLSAALSALSGNDWTGEWQGVGVPATGAPFRIALTVAVVRHADGNVYRARWSLRDISRRTLAD
jgi:PAS domain S-box-containing protein